jgi:hypothetical protein
LYGNSLFNEINSSDLNDLHILDSDGNIADFDFYHDHSMNSNINNNNYENFNKKPPEKNYILSPVPSHDQDSSFAFQNDYMPNNLSSFDFAKDIDDFNDLLLEFSSEIVPPLTNCMNQSTSSPQTQSQNFHNQIQSINHNFEMDVLPKPKTIFDELRDLIPTIPSQNKFLKRPPYVISNQPNLKSPFISSNSHLSSIQSESTSETKCNRQKALARYRAKKLKRMINKKQQPSNSRYILRQEIAFRRPRNNGRFMKIQTRFVSVSQFPSTF